MLVPFTTCCEQLYKNENFKESIKLSSLLIADCNQNHNFITIYNNTRKKSLPEI